MKYGNTEVEETGSYSLRELRDELGEAWVRENNLMADNERLRRLLKDAEINNWVML